MAAEHPFDRLSKRLAARSPAPARGVSRRGLLLGSAGLALAAALRPLRFAVPALGAGVTSCSCADYASNTFATCFDSHIPSSFPGDGVAAGMLWSAVAYEGTTQCKPKEEQAKKNCTEMPCPPGQTCNTHHVSVLSATPQFQPPVCESNCPQGETSCPDGCQDLSGDADNCGGCGVTCKAGDICVNGSCVECQSSFLCP